MLYRDRWFYSAYVLVGLSFCIAPQPLNAQTQYPSQPINLVVAAGAGGFADVVARVIGDKLGEKLKQHVVVENKGGAGGNLAARAVAQARPDGYTVLVSTTQLAINRTLYKNKGYADSDIKVVAIVGAAPEVIAVHPSNTAQNLSEFVRQQKDRKIEYGSAGVGTGSFIAAEYLFKVLAKSETVHVPFAGGAPGIRAVIANHLTSMAATLPAFVPHINSGTLKGLGIASEKRSSVVPSVPTYAESGFPGFYASSWVGFFVHGQTNGDIVIKLNATINEILKDPAVQTRLTSLGLELMSGNVEQTNSYFDREVAQWAKMVSALGLSID